MIRANINKIQLNAMNQTNCGVVLRAWQGRIHRQYRCWNIHQSWTSAEKIKYSWKLSMNTNRLFSCWKTDRCWNWLGHRIKTQIRFRKMIKLIVSIKQINKKRIVHSMLGANDQWERFYLLKGSSFLIQNKLKSYVHLCA